MEQEIVRLAVAFGDRSAWEAFADAHSEFLKRLNNLQALLKKVFIRDSVTASPADRVIFVLGCLAVEDFMEILLLCGNGYGIAGLKLLRGMYEKCVTARYLSGHPGEVEDFLDYHHVREWKLHKRVLQTYPGRQIVSREKAEQMQQEYERVRNRFTEPLCQKCGTTTPQISWSKLDTFSMALKAGHGLDGLYLSCYLVPTLQAHATPSAVSVRLQAPGEAGLSFDAGPQPSWVEWALVSAHNLILGMIDLQIGHFGLALENDWQEAASDNLGEEARGGGSGGSAAGLRIHGRSKSRPGGPAAQARMPIPLAQYALLPVCLIHPATAPG
jgi:hypothetical protein